MLDFFAVITKGGLVLWYFQDAAQQLDSSIVAINALIKNVVLQERSGVGGVYDHNNLALKMAQDNEFDLLYVVIYQRILQLSYVDKFLSDIQRKFREQFGARLQNGEYYKSFEFSASYTMLLRVAEEESRLLRSLPNKPRTFQESDKSKKTIDSMVQHRGLLFSSNNNNETTSKKKKKKEEKAAAKKLIKQECNNNNNKSDGKDSFEQQQLKQQQLQEQQVQEQQQEQQLHEQQQKEQQEQQEHEMAVPESGSSDSREGSVEGGSGDASDGSGGGGSSGGSGGRGPGDGKPEELDTTAIFRNRQMLFRGKLANRKQKPGKPQKKGKEARVWDLDGKDSTSLDYSRTDSAEVDFSTSRPDYLPSLNQIGTLGGGLRGMDVVSEGQNKTSGLFSMFRGLVGGKNLEAKDVAPMLEKLQDLLIGKNVAAEIAVKLCASIETKLIGKHLGSFEGVAGVVRATLEESLLQLLTPKRRLDVLRDVREAREARRPYTIAFCGVNGVGKSTNLAKVCFWLVENNYRVLIAACDTFRAGAVEQLRTHVRHLNSLHPPSAHNGSTMVELYEQGYGKDAAEIARAGIDHGRKHGYDVVLIDTAGRMQDNEPLMRALAKLILVNEPDLTLFVGEALVGNEAVDQLVKFNRALANHSTASAVKANMIDGILLTKFDTIDDKVGAIISMAYVTGQPIVFVGTGQTYADLRSLDAKAVVSLLMK